MESSLLGFLVCCFFFFSGKNIRKISIRTASAMLHEVGFFIQEGFFSLNFTSSVRAGSFFMGCF